MSRRGARLVVVAVVVLAAGGLFLGLSLSQRKAQPGAHAHLASCTIANGQVMASGTAVNRTGDTQVIDLLVADVGEEAGTEFVAPAHGTGSFSVRLDGGHPPCVLERARVVQSVPQVTSPAGGPTPLGSVPTG
jgi:hypothetical protein